MFMSDNIIEWDVAEVLSYDRTYKYIPLDDQNSNVSSLFALQVRSCKSIYNQQSFIALPGNANLKQIPLVGEFVLIYKTYTGQSRFKQSKEQWYYISTIAVHTNINENLLPGISGVLTDEELSKFSPGVTYKSNTVSPLQPYEGDILFEGRHGNSIRLSSTILIGDTNPYTIDPTWSPSDSGLTDGNTNPIIILSNTSKHRAGKQFMVESINEDDSSLYLTSTQKLNTLKLHNNLNQSADDPNSFSKSQFIGVADRIILKSKTDVVAIDSNKSIELNSPLLSIGNKQDSDKEYGLHSTAVKELFDAFFYLITLGGLKDSNGMPVTCDPTFTNEFYKIQEKLTNYKIRQDKGDQ